MKMVIVRCLRFMVRASVIVAAIVLGSCAFNAATLPSGIIAEQAQPGARVGGIYAGVPNDPSCCWADQDVTFRVTKPSAADDFALKIYIPELAVFRSVDQGFAATFDDRYRVERCCFGPGLHIVLFRLPPPLRTRVGVVGVHLHARRSFVPAQEQYNADKRRLAFVFVSAKFTTLFSGRF